MLAIVQMNKQGQCPLIVRRDREGQSGLSEGREYSDSYDPRWSDSGRECIVIGERQILSSSSVIHTYIHAIVGGLGGGMCGSEEAMIESIITRVRNTTITYLHPMMRNKNVLASENNV